MDVDALAAVVVPGVLCDRRRSLTLGRSWLSATEIVNSVEFAVRHWTGHLEIEMFLADIGREERKVLREC